MLAVRSASSSAARCRAASSTWHLFEDLPIAESSRSARRYLHSTSNSRSPFPHRQPEDAAEIFSGKIRSGMKESRRVKKEQAMKKAYKFSAALRKASFVGTRRNPLEPLSPAPRSSEPTATGPDKSVAELIDDILKVSSESARKLELNPERYRKAYKKAFERISQSFVLKQLREVIGKEMRGYTKAMLIQQIMQAKGWPVPPPKKQEKKKEAPIPAETKVLELSDSALFLFIRDTKFISDLYFTQGITLSTILAEDGSSNINLAATGSVESLERLDIALAKRAQHTKYRSISSDDIHGLTPSQGLLTFVSRMTGAHIGQVEGDQYRISTMNPAKIDEVVRLLEIAGFRQSILSPQISRLILTPPSHSTATETDLFAVMPFFAPPSMSIPWENNSASGEVLYRFRKVKNWQSRSNRQEVSHRDELMEDGSIISFEGDAEDSLKMSAGNLAQSAGSGRTTLTTTFGHLLLRHNEGTSGSVLSSPVSGQWPMIESRRQLEQVARPFFSPFLTPSMAHYASDHGSQRLRRLRYRRADGKTDLTFTHTYPAPKHIPTPRATPMTPGNEETDNWLIKLENMVAEMEKQEKEKEKKLLGEDEGETKADEGVEALDESAGGIETDSATPSEISDSPEVQEVKPKWTIHAEQSEVREVDMMMPDRPVDARMTCRSSSALESVPDEVEQFFSEVIDPPARSMESGKAKAKSPVAPRSILIEQMTYTLHQDEELEITETASEQEGVLLRSVQAKDMILNDDRLVFYTELEYAGETIPAQYWRDLANITRDVQPGSRSLQVEAGLRL